MRNEGELVLAVGYQSLVGPRSENQDFAAVYFGSPIEQSRHGTIAAIADGVSGGKEGGTASELAVRSLIEGYYSIPHTLGAARAMQVPLAAFNRWLHAMGQSDTMRNSATTFTAFALRGRHGHLVHVGDSRAWRFSGDRLTRLTTDHTRSEPDLQHVLIRAVGIEAELRLDHANIELAEHDRLLLTTDGIHGTLSDRKIAAIMARGASAKATAAELADEALKAGGNDNATAIVIDIVRLPNPDHDGILEGMSALPPVDPPKPGESIDGFGVESLVSEGRYAVVLAALDSETGTRVALKFPRPEALSDRAIRLAFTREILLGQLVDSPFVLGAHPVRPDRQTALYGVQPLLEGETMDERLKNGLPAFDQALALAIKLVRGVAALHRLEVVHRDIKPENVILTGDEGLQLIDLGVARLPRAEDFHGDEIPGTPGYMAPEQFKGSAGDAKTDLFALGVTLYQWFTGKWPFGEQEAFQRPRFGNPTPPSHYRPEIPSWLDDAILTAIQTDPEKRFDDAIGLLRRLEGGGTIARREPLYVPLIERNPVRFWQIVSTALAVGLIFALVMR